MLSCDVVHATRDYELVGFHVFALHAMTFKLSLRFCVFNKSELYNFTFDFFSQDELIQVEAGNHQSGTTVIQQNVSSPV